MTDSKSMIFAEAGGEMAQTKEDDSIGWTSAESSADGLINVKQETVLEPETSTSYVTVDSSQSAHIPASIFLIVSENEFKNTVKRESSELFIAFEMLHVLIFVERFF